MTTITAKQEKIIIDITAVAAIAIIGTYYDTARPSSLHEIAAVASVGVLFYVGKRYLSPMINKLTPWKNKG
ncbi:TPA: hypothetical protein J9755_000391 [Escherichia coli]|nr:hypothetical protein [Escherichia coli]